MALPTADDIRSFLEGYNITATFLSDTWILARRDNNVKPWMERIIRQPLEGTEEVTEYVSGNGKSVLVLSRKNIVSLTSIEYVTGGDYDSSIGLGGVELLAEEGMLKAITNITEGGYNVLFNKGSKNIKITYTVGSTTIPAELKEAMIYLVCEQALGFIGARTGGGSVSGDGFSRNFGSRGKYQDIRDDLKRQAMALMQPYMTGIVSR